MNLENEMGMTFLGYILVLTIPLTYEET